jgi:hypothetical protein
VQSSRLSSQQFALDKLKTNRKLLSQSFRLIKTDISVAKFEAYRTFSSSSGDFLACSLDAVVGFFKSKEFLHKFLARAVSS